MLRTTAIRALLISLILFGIGVAVGIFSEQLFAVNKSTATSIFDRRSSDLQKFDVRRSIIIDAEAGILSARMAIGPVISDDEHSVRAISIIATGNEPVSAYEFTKSDALRSQQVVPQQAGDVSNAPMNIKGDNEEWPPGLPLMVVQGTALRECGDEFAVATWFYDYDFKIDVSWLCVPPIDYYYVLEEHAVYSLGYNFHYIPYDDATMSALISVLWNSKVKDGSPPPAFFNCVTDAGLDRCESKSEGYIKFDSATAEFWIALRRTPEGYSRYVLVHELAHALQVHAGTEIDHGCDFYRVLDELWEHWMGHSLKPYGEAYAVRWWLPDCEFTNSRLKEHLLQHITFECNQDGPWSRCHRIES